MIVFTQDRFEALLETVRARIAKLFPISGTNNTISVENLRWENVGSDIYNDPDYHKKYKITGRTLAARLVGTVKITDNKTKKVIDSAAKHPILLVPHITSKQSFIVSGKEVQIVNQLRLKPGAYTRYTVDNNIECFVNTAGGGYRVQLDRVTSVFHLRVGQSTYIYLYPVLKALGIGDDVLRRVWGDKVLAANRAYDRPGEMARLYKKLRPYAEMPKDPEALNAAVRSFFESKALDPNITKLTLGAPYAKIEPKVLLAASERALMLSKGETKADDTENLAFKSLHSVDDFVLERIDQNVDAAVRSIKYNVDRRPTVVETLPPSLFSKPVISFFTTSEFSRYSDQNNPLDMIGVQSFVTVLGEGGIGSAYSISDNLRALHPSHIYALDPVHIPECFDEKTEVMTWEGWVPWPKILETTKFACLVNGRVEFLPASKIIVEDYDGEMYGVRGKATEYLVTPNHRVWSSLFMPPHFEFHRADTVHKSIGRYVLSGCEAPVDKEEPKPILLISSDYYVEQYHGKVYCATVPGGLLYCRRNGKLGHWTGNSTKIGITSHLALGASKIGNDVAITVINTKTGKQETIKLFDLEDKTVAFHDQYDHTRTPPRPKTSMVKARLHGELKMVPASSVDYIFEHPSRMFGYVASAVPFVHTNSPNRVLMASHHIEQAVALADPDVPLVQAKFGTKGYESVAGKLLVPQAAVDGTVTRIKGNVITIKGDDKQTYTIKLHENYPLNSNAFLHERPIVKEGDRVKKGQPLADSDFTRNGELALGKTLRTAYIPYKGYNFEDGIVASESAAKKLTSVHKHEIRLDLDRTIVVSLTRLLAHFPSYLTALDRSKYGPDGLPRKGVILNFEDIVIPAVRKIKVHEEFDYSKLHKSLANQWMDISKKWDNHVPGEVVDVVKTPGFISVYCKTYEPLEVGDKISHRHGGKGIVTLILPDNEMYRDQQGRVIDLLFNPAGVLGRANPGQLLEAAAGKIAEKTGKTYIVNNFGDSRQLDAIERDLQANGMGTDVAETLHDPTTNKDIPDVMVGNLHVVKLRHQVSKKLSARGTTSYTHDESPARGESENPMAIGSMELYSLLSGGATAFLRDAVTIKCFPWNAKVETEFGPIDIATIVNNRMSVRVKSLDPEGNLVWQPVVNYFKYRHGPPSRRIDGCDRPLVDVVVPKITRGTGRATPIRATDNHEIMTARGKVEIKNLTDSDEIVVVGRDLSVAQKAVLTGVLLGDGCIAAHDQMQLPHLALRHTVEQQEYLLWKTRLLSDLGWGQPYSTQSVSPTTGRKCPQVAVYSACSLSLIDFERKFYEDSHKGVQRSKARRKRIDESTLEFFDVRSAAIMFMDDGTVSCRPTKKDHRGVVTVRFCIGDCTNNEARLLAEKFRTLFGINATWTKKAGGNQRLLCISGFDAQELLFQIAPFVYPTFTYKMMSPRRGIEEALRQRIGSKIRELEEACRGGTETTFRVPFKVRPAPKTSRYTSFVYDIEVADTHNYVVSGVVVGNSNKNDDYWRAVQMGLPTPPPKTPFIVDKFITYMKGAGINVKQDGTTLKALPMTDKDILQQSNGEIKSPGVVKANDLSPEQGGLFDRGLTGGFSGSYWNHITLAEPIPNPLMDQAIITLLGTLSRPFSRAEFSGLLNGTLWLTPDDRLVTESKGNITGGAALKKLLSKIDVQAELRSMRAQIPHLTGAKRDLAVKRLRYLTALDKMGLSPVEAYINQHVPVIPAKMRAIYPNPDGTLNVADPIHGYREVILINNQIKDLKNLGVDAKNIAPLYSQLYAAARGLVGLQEPLTRGENFKGFIATIKGQQNKYGLFQNKVIKRRQDLSGRSTIIPDPKLGIDEAKIPDEMAFTIYKPFIVQKLVEMGHDPKSARDMIEKREKLARSALEVVIKERPVILNRAPSLHKFSLLAFKPQLTPGKAIEINPLVVKGFNADFDGDAMMVHVPVSEEARNEALTKLLPSRNLFSPRDNSIVHAPSMEMILGIYLMTTPKGVAKRAGSEQEVLSLYKAGKIPVNQAMMVNGKIICAGQIIFNEAIPKELRPGYVSIDKKTLMPLLGRIAKEKPAIAGQVITKVKDLGNHYVTEVGWSFSLRDLHFPEKEKNAILRDAAKEAPKAGFGPAFSKAFERMQKAVAEHKDNRIVLGGLTSGAFGKAEQITQTIAAPVAVTDHQGKVIEIPITNPFAQGLDSGSYWSIIPGSRKGLMDRTLSTSDTGAFSKQLLATTVATTITMQDCGTTDGLTMDVTNPDIHDRVIASGPYKGKITDPQLLRNLQARGIKTLTVRSPLRCKATRGICAMCFGPLENGQMPNIGYHIGALAGQTISEPATQLTMKAFHTSGAVGTNAIGYQRLIQIMEMPTNVRGKASLAMKAGKVESITPGPAGGWNVLIGGLNHFVPQELGLAVTKGQSVSAGQMLSKAGLIRPQDVLQATNDIRKVQDQLINDLNQVMVNAGVRIKRKIYETAIQPFTNRAVVEDPGDGDVMFGIHTGDTVSTNVLDEMNQKLKAKGKRPIIYTATLMSLKKTPHYHEDFIGELIAERPHETLKRAPALGATSDIGPDGHPVATYAFGRYFGTRVRENVSKTADEIIGELDDMIKASTVVEDQVLPADDELTKMMLEIQRICDGNRVGHDNRSVRQRQG